MSARAHTLAGQTRGNLEKLAKSLRTERRRAARERRRVEEEGRLSETERILIRDLRSSVDAGRPIDKAERRILRTGEELLAAEQADRDATSEAYSVRRHYDRLRTMLPAKVVAEVEAKYELDKPTGPEFGAKGVAAAKARFGSDDDD